MRNSIAKANGFIREKKYSEAIVAFQDLLKNYYLDVPPLKDQVEFNLKYVLKKSERSSFLVEKRQRIAVYTAITGGYDKLSDPLFKAENVDFYVFSDSPVESATWTRIPFNYHNSCPTKVARFVKLNPHLYFDDYQVSIWVDANIEIIGDVNAIVDRLGSVDIISLFAHPHRNCVYVEGAECIKRNKDSSEAILKQLEQYTTGGHPANTGMWETGFLVRRHNDPSCIKLMADWWGEVFSKSKRDQLSLPVVFRNRGVTPLTLGSDLREDNNLLYRKHLKLERAELDRDFNIKSALIDISGVTVTIVVCVYNALEDVSKCLAALINNMKENYQIVIVDDFSEVQTKKYLAEFSKGKSFVRLLRNERNLGYTKSANIGIRLSDSDYTILLNSDTIITDGAIEGILMAGERHRNIGLVGPLSNAATWQSVPYVKDEKNSFAVNAIPEGFSVDSFAKLFRKNGTLANPYSHLVNGFCYAIKRSVIEAIGYLDEESFPVGYGEEDDYSLRALKAGFVACIAVSSFVYHAKSKSFTPEGRKPLAKAGLAKLIEKHGNDYVFSSAETLNGNQILSEVRARLIRDIEFNSSKV